MRLYYFLTFFLVLTHFFTPLHAASSPRIITDKLDRPWSLAFLPNGDFLVTERGGQLRQVSSTGNISFPITGLPNITAVGQGGLLDVVLHPDFETNHWVYVSYVAGSAVQGYSTEVIRGVLTLSHESETQSVNGGHLNDVKKLFVALPKTKGSRHFGGRLLLAKQRGQTYLFLSLGDRGVKSLSQNLNNHHGSLIRLHDNGDTPTDNPFVNTRGALPEIYSYGHRNIQGLALHPNTNAIWLHEHGPQGGDELNRIQAGRNYGWPVVTYGVNYGIATTIGEGTHKVGMEQPHYMWDPSIAPSGLAFYKDKWLVGALKYQLLSVLTPLSHVTSAASTLKNNGSTPQLIQRFKENRYFSQQFGRIRDVRIKGNKLYLLTDSGQGKLIQLPANF